MITHYRFRVRLYYYIASDNIMTRSWWWVEYSSGARTKQIYYDNNNMVSLCLDLFYHWYETKKKITVLIDVNDLFNNALNNDKLCLLNYTFRGYNFNSFYAVTATVSTAERGRVNGERRPRIKINTKQIACFTVQYLSNALKSREPLYTLQPPRHNNNNIL